MQLFSSTLQQKLGYSWLILLLFLVMQNEADDVICLSDYDSRYWLEITDSGCWNA